MFVACQGGHINIVKELLNRGANVHVAMKVILFLKKMLPMKLIKQKQMKDRATALFIASQNGHRTILSMLLTEGADPDACRKDGASPLWIAAQMGHDHIVIQFSNHLLIQRQFCTLVFFRYVFCCNMEQISMQFDV